jgi:hypothetical protein
MPDAVKTFVLIVLLQMMIDEGHHRNIRSWAFRILGTVCLLQ